MPTVHLLIKGKVQGVFYRASAKEVADGLGITGWIKNTANGDVEAMATGNAEQVRLFVAWCEQGPRKAVVEEVISTAQEEIVFDVFSVKRF